MNHRVFTTGNRLKKKATEAIEKYLYLICDVCFHLFALVFVCRGCCFFPLVPYVALTRSAHPYTDTWFVPFPFRSPVLMEYSSVVNVSYSMEMA